MRKRGPAAIAACDYRAAVSTGRKRLARSGASRWWAGEPDGRVERSPHPDMVHDNSTQQTSPVFDVAVIGGGPAGIGAAVAAGRMGARTVVVERHDVLGGMGTSALVNNFCPAHLDGSRMIIGGVFAELRRRLIERKRIYASMNFSYRMEPYDPAVFAELADTMCREAGVEVRCGSGLAAVEFSESAPTRITLQNGHVLRAKTVVDSSGDGFVAALAGVPFTFGRSKDGAVMPLTFCYRIGPIDLDALERALPGTVHHHAPTGERHCCISNHPATNVWVAEARASGELTIPRDHIAAILSVPGRPDHATVNFGRVFCKDPTNPAELAQAEAEGRRQIDEGVRFFRKYLPGFERVELKEVARQIGVRETRQIQGLYTLTGPDATSCRQFEDVIAQCCYAIDIHEPDTEGTTMKEFRPGTHYDIPWRALVPASGPANLVIGGRCVSATQEAMSSFRVAPSVMAIGEAAGVTAALAARNGGVIRKVDPKAVQARLRETGGILV